MIAFVQYCQKFPQITVKEYAEQLESLQLLGKEIENIPLNHVCEILDLTTEISNSFSLEEYTPNIIYFKGINRDVMETILNIINLDSSKLVLFNHFFNNACQHMLINSQKNPIEIKESVSILWEMTLTDLKQILLPIESGLFELSQLDTLLETFFNSNFTSMEAEISYLLEYFKINNLEQRKSQIKMWNRFKASHQTAVTIDKIRIRMKIQTIFDQLIDLLAIDSDVYTTWNLLKMDETLGNIVAVLDGINSPDKLECLRAFAESIELVEWLRANVKSMSEFRVLIDLILEEESSTNGPNRDLMAKILLEAGSAYASFIFDLKQDCGFFRFFIFSFLNENFFLQVLI